MVIDWDKLSGWNPPTVPDDVVLHEVQDEDTQDLEGLEELEIEEEEEGQV